MTAASSLLRAAVARHGPTSFFRANALPGASRPLASRAGLLVAVSTTTTTGAGFSTSARMRSEHHEETFEEFTAR